MQPSKITSVLLGSIAALTISAQAQTLTSQFNTPTTYNTGDTVVAAVGPNGTALAPIGVVNNQTQGDPDGYSLTNNPGGVLADGWNTNTPFTSLIAGDGSFTAFAIAGLNDNSNDNMIFGTDNNAPLHLGFRNDQVFFGFWGNDSSTVAGTAPVPGGPENIYTWRFDAALGTQDIFRDGVLLNTSGGHGPYVNGGNLTIGTNGGNGGDYNGDIDDTRLYNSALSDADVATITAQMSVPEPTSLAVLMGGTATLLGLRRRRS